MRRRGARGREVAVVVTVVVVVLTRGSLDGGLNIGVKFGASEAVAIGGVNWLVECKASTCAKLSGSAMFSPPRLAGSCRKSWFPKFAVFLPMALAANRSASVS